jgi:hypothetical protein
VLWVNVLVLQPDDDGRGCLVRLIAEPPIHEYWCFGFLQTSSLTESWGVVLY